MLRSKPFRVLSKRNHTLIVPEVHAPYTPFKNGVPQQLVRELKPKEKIIAKDLRWSSSIKHSFHLPPPNTFGMVTVPEGEVWIVERAKTARLIKSGNGAFL
jgi:hypothetical protein